MIQLHDVEQGSAEWQATRNGKFTGSSAYKLLKFGQIEYSKTESTDFRGNFYTKRGHVLEEEAIDLYQQITGESVARPGYVTNDRFPMCLYSPDGLTDDLVIEVKCFNVAKHMAMIDGDIDFKIKAQIHFGMFVTEKKGGRLVIYNPDIENPKDAFCMIDIPYNQNIIDKFERRLAI